MMNSEPNFKFNVGDLVRVDPTNPIFAKLFKYDGLFGMIGIVTKRSFSPNNIDDDCNYYYVFIKEKERVFGESNLVYVEVEKET